MSGVGGRDLGWPSDAVPAGRLRLPHVVVALVIGIVVAGCRPLSDEEGQRSGGRERQGATARQRLSPEEIERVARRMNVAVGHLENEDFAKAEPLLEELTNEVPGEIAPLRNLAICRALIVRDLALGDGARTAPQERYGAMEGAVGKARATTDGLIDAEGESAVALWLRGKVELLASPGSGLAAGTVYLERAAAREPGNVVVRWELYDASRYVPDEAFKSIGIKALEEAYKARPDNLFLMLEWLGVQVSRKDPSLAETLARARGQLEPLRESITSVDVFKLVDAASEAAGKGDWAATLRDVRPLTAVTKPQDAVQSDRKELAPRLVAFVVHDFSEEFYRANPPRRPAGPPAIEVAMESFTPRFPPVEDVRDVELVDFDVDGVLDVVLLGEGRVEVFSRQASAGEWTRIAEADVPSTMSRLVAADLYMVDLPEAPKKRSAHAVDARTLPAVPREAAGEAMHHDVYPGLGIYGADGVVLLRNEMDEEKGGQVLEAVEQSAEMERLRNVLRVLPADLDQDGDLDLVVAGESGLSLWSNRSDMTFRDVSAWSVLPGSGAGAGGMIAVDWDRDLDVDVLLSGPAGENGGLLENVRHGQFHWRPFKERYGLLDAVTSMALLDADGNRSWDVVAAGPSGVELNTTTTSRRGAVEQLGAEMLLNEPQDDCTVWDFDNDGCLDVLAWGEGVHVLRGTPDGTWAEVADMAPEAAGPIVECLPADLDNDGDLDLAVVTDNGVVLYANEGGNKNRFLAVRVRGTNDQTKCGRVNHYCIGSLLEVRCGARYQVQVIQRQTTHFGLGSAERADTLRMLLTNGVPQQVVEPESDQLLREFMRSKGM